MAQRKTIKNTINLENSLDKVVGSEKSTATTGYSEYFQQSDNVSLTVIGNTADDVSTLNLNPTTGITVTGNVSATGNISANELQINGIPISKVSETGNYSDLTPNSGQPNLSTYAQLTLATPQTWVGQQLFSRAQVSTAPIANNDVVNLGYANTNYKTPVATKSTVGTVMTPAAGGLNIDVSGNLGITVDGTTTQINNGKLIALPQNNGVQTITSTGKTLTPTVNGSTVNLELNPATSNTFTSLQTFDAGLDVAGGIVTDTLLLPNPYTGTTPPTGTLAKVAFTGAYGDLASAPDLSAYVKANFPQTWSQNQTFSQSVTTQNNNATINGLPTPLDATDATPKSYVDNIVNGNTTFKGNDTFTGIFTSKSIVDNGTNVTLSKPEITVGITDTGGISTTGTFTSKSITDTGTSPTVSVPLVVQTPTLPTHAVTKAYADNIVTGNTTFTGTDSFSKALSVPDLTVPATYSPVSGDASTSLKTILSNMSNGSKYDFIITGQNTPTFTVGEEYLSVTTDVGEDSSNYTYQEQISVNDIVTTLQLQINELTARLNNLENK